MGPLRADVPGHAATSSSAASASRFDGFGQRDHSWGFRHWAGLHQWHWVTGFLADGRGFNLFEVHEHDGTHARSTASCRPPTAIEYVVGADRDAGRGPTTAAPSATALHAPPGRRRPSSTSPASGPGCRSRCARPTTSRSSCTRRRCASHAPTASTGYGIYEHLVTGVRLSPGMTTASSRSPTWPGTQPSRRVAPARRPPGAGRRRSTECVRAGVGHQAADGRWPCSSAVEEEVLDARRAGRTARAHRAPAAVPRVRACPSTG